jgi:hypothetical protein
LTKILEDEVTAPEATIISEPYQQILAVFTSDRSALRAKDRPLGSGADQVVAVLGQGA